MSRIKEGVRNLLPSKQKNPQESPELSADEENKGNLLLQMNRENLQNQIEEEK